MTDLLLITDVPRLRKVFNRLADDKGITLRTASSLEKGVEELIARKPAMVFVQTHLSGLSADILLMHLKKQLGRKRSRFVLLGTPTQVSAETIKLYQGHIDTSLGEKALLDAIRNMVATPARKGQSGLEAALAVEDMVSTTTAARPAPPPEPAAAEPEREATVAPVTRDILALTVPPTAPPEPSLEDQGITYAPRSRVTVYSEFTSSFDSAVESMQEQEPPAEPVRQHFSGWDVEQLETIEPKKTLSKRSSFLLWLAPVLIAAVVVTVIQNRKPEGRKPVAIITEPPLQQAKPAPQPAVPAQPPVAAVQKPAAAPVPRVAAAPPTADGGATPQLSDKAILSDIAGNRGSKEQPTPSRAGVRPSKLPDFIPRYGADKSYGAANPGWERYKGQVTEFKVFREKETIKAIQVIDRGGQGVPESFMRGVLHQVVKKPAFVLEATEKKDGYEIQRGRIADNLKVVYYRDERGGRLRAFVMTWQ
ncbi:hypothetical protein F6V30_01635 [Oryzomonas sagensis]|uniref:Response regulatory domain-containing protein n=1 Tax=Oryzomonas sagensis TaxID=2603857 RepID=A0ABQ6TR41_9BACT|nr:hypothetical protein [Oryzomonas sagensis]KAB0671312.1 hypothetical protein F6V30_01635 [Oryzomonas sagensis]